MDFKDAAGKEVAALQARQQYLATLATQRTIIANSYLAKEPAFHSVGTRPLVTGCQYGCLPCRRDSIPINHS